MKNALAAFCFAWVNAIMAFGAADVGQDAPKLDGKYLDEQKAVSSDKAKVRLISFWSANCPRAVQVVPRLKELGKTYQSKGLTLIAPSADEKAAEEEFQKKFDIKEYSLLYDAKASVEAFKVEEYPTAFLVGSNGKIAWRGNPTTPELDPIMVALLAASAPADERFPMDTAQMPAVCKDMMEQVKKGEMKVPECCKQMMEQMQKGKMKMPDSGQKPDTKSDAEAPGQENKRQK